MLPDRTRSWFRVLAAGVAMALLAFGIAHKGVGWGPCGPADGWGLFVGLAGLLFATAVVIALSDLILSAVGVLLRATRPQSRP